MFPTFLHIAGRGLDGNRPAHTVCRRRRGDAASPLRTALLDAPDALEPHREALVVIGAHAVYEHTHDSGVPATVTVDADAMVVPEFVTSDHSIVDASRAAGLHLKNDARPGIYEHPSRDVTVDLRCAEAVAGAGKRGARIVGQSKHGVGRAIGLELALVDHATRTITAIDGTDRSSVVKVAGTAALLCAKAHELADRFDDMTTRGRPDRLRPKDAADVWRLMQVSDPHAARATFNASTDDALIGTAVTAGRERLERLFTPGSMIVQLVADNLDGTYAATAAGFIDEWMTRFEHSR